MGACSVVGVGFSDLLDGEEFTSVSHYRIASKRKVPRSALHDWVKAYETMLKAKDYRLNDIEYVIKRGPNELIDIGPLLDHSRPESWSYKDLKDDRVWPVLLLDAIVTKAVTDIDGKYEMKNIHGGEYYLYAEYPTAFNYIDWLIPVRVDKSQSLKIDLFNGTARIIRNRSDD